MAVFPAPLRPARRRKLPYLVSWRTIFALMLREMSTTYGRSPGGYIWAILEPVAGIALLTLVFSVAFASPPLGISFEMFYATGMLPFLLFGDVAGRITQALNYSRQLLAYSRVTFIDAILARFFLNMLTQLLVNYLVLGGILLFFSTRVIMDGPTILTAYALVGLLALGVGTFNCYMMTRFMVYQRIWSVVMRPLFVVSCIFFLLEAIPQPFQGILWFNPLVHVIGLMRSGFYPNYDAVYVSELYVVLFALIPMLIGLVLLRHNHRTLFEL